MFTRLMENTLQKFANFPVIAILGPRQSGKTTLAQKAYPDHAFVSLENPILREFALKEPAQFLESYANKNGLIIDEFQYVPQILSYIQLDVDAKKRKSFFILTGSQNFLVNQAITQSLAGRVGILNLQPLSLRELAQNNLLPKSPAKTVFNGFYPRLYNEQFTPEQLYPSYIQTYIERDVRQIINVGDLGTFQKFLQLCASRIGNLLNLSDLAMVCGISVTTARRWLSLLEASYIIFLLEPYFNNFSKRLTKMPKLYFYDTGLACSLLRISSPEALALHPFWGSLFECCIIADIAKQYFNQGSRPPFYFWRDKNGRLEVDCLIDEAGMLFPIEVKASERISNDFFTGLSEWNRLAYGENPQKDPAAQTYLLYAGNEKQIRTQAQVVPWTEAGSLVTEITRSGKRK
ncbi:MAG: hypothetical protein UV38_C0001G0078 [candidate division TM6 bacterium GW2011_GWE2_42_60]|nr:MAG: hypothetical protein UV38_C0001G0078 [candidate division TM6 bacterium GW2011_GWE2_42_60]HBY05727.1 AAA family ATPase [Candidatus Dependentiae bacterium]